jgi:hypothetical protein
MVNAWIEEMIEAVVVTDATRAVILPETARASLLTHATTVVVMDTWPEIARRLLRHSKAATDATRKAIWLVIALKKASQEASSLRIMANRATVATRKVI